MSALSDTIADEVSKEMQRYYHANRLRITYPVTSSHFRDQVRSLASALETVNPLNLMTAGALKSNLHPTHARMLAMKILEGFVQAEKSERLSFEATLKPGFVPPMS